MSCLQNGVAHQNVNSSSVSASATLQTTCPNNYVLLESSSLVVELQAYQRMNNPDWLYLHVRHTEITSDKGSIFIVFWRYYTTDAVQASMNSREDKNETDLREKFWRSMMFSFCFTIKEPGRIFLVKTRESHVKWFLNYKTPLSKV